MKRRYCPTRKPKHFNEAWANIAAQEQTERFGVRFKVYLCRCGWWHLYDRAKKRAKDNRREPEKARKRRASRGDPPLFHDRTEQLNRERRTLKRRRHKNRATLSLRVWEDDGGAFWPPREERDTT